MSILMNFGHRRKMNSCPLCEDKFSTSDNLRQHIKGRSKDVNSPSEKKTACKYLLNNSYLKNLVAEQVAIGLKTPQLVKFMEENKNCVCNTPEKRETFDVPSTPYVTKLPSSFEKAIDDEDGVDDKDNYDENESSDFDGNNSSLKLKACVARVHIQRDSLADLKHQLKKINQWNRYLEIKISHITAFNAHYAKRDIDENRLKHMIETSASLQILAELAEKGIKLDIEETSTTERELCQQFQKLLK